MLSTSTSEIRFQSGRLIISKFISLLLIFFSSQTLYAETPHNKSISLRADAWPPYNSTPGSKKPGYMIEIIEYALRKHDYTLDYQLLPWERSIELTANGDVHCVVGAYKVEVPHFIFPTQPLGVEDVGFYGRSDARNWKFESLHSFEGYNIGVIGGYSYGAVIDSYIANPNNKIHISKGDDALERNLKMLMQNRIDILLESPNVMNYQMQSLPFAKNIKLLDTFLLQGELYIACSPKKAESQGIVTMIDEGLSELRKTGKLKKILSRYGLQDWQKTSKETGSEITSPK